MELINSVSDINRVRELLDSGVDPNTRDINGDTILLFASSRDRIEIVKLLLQSGAEPNLVNTYSGSTPLHLASSYGYTDIVRLLLEAGANPNITNGNGNTPLHLASSSGYTDIVRLLLETGANPNIRDRNGNTPLISASSRDRIEIVKMLLEHGVDPSIRNNDGESAYDLAIEFDNSDIVKLIQDHIDLLRMQIPQQNLAFMKYFLDRDNLDIDTASKIFSNVYSYNPSVHTRIINEHKDPLTKSKQRLATMKGIRDRNSVLQYLREPELMENVNKYLSSMRPQPSVYSRMMLEDKQKGKGKHGKKRSKKCSGKKKSKTKKK